jgi:hypothetical protein
MSDLNFNPIPSEIKYFMPGKETVNDIPNLFGSLQKMKMAVVNIVLPWIDFKAAMISSWWSTIVFSAWSACLFMSQNVCLTVFLSSSISFCSF